MIWFRAATGLLANVFPEVSGRRTHRPPRGCAESKRAKISVAATNLNPLKRLIGSEAYGRCDRALRKAPWPPREG